MRKIKSLIKKIIPESVLDKLVWFFSQQKLLDARKRFELAGNEPAWLGWDELETLQKRYPFRITPDYDSETRYQRAETLAKDILKLADSKSRNINKFLELGCQEGYVCLALNRLGKDATGIDIDFGQFSDEVKQAGVGIHNMSASKLDFSDGSFDFVFSHASFEHFDDPESALKEAVRVVRKGGFIYLYFGPLYMSPLGLHAYGSITVPYCQMLFPLDMIIKFCVEHDLRHKKFIYVNGWPYESYMNLFDSYSDILTKVRYTEKRTTLGLELIARYPSCFKSKTKYFDDMLVDSIDVLFRKTG